MKPSRPELVRKLGHIAFGVGAFLVRPIGVFGAAAVALAGLLFNLLLLSHFGGRALWRLREAVRGFAAGIVLYPLSVLFVLLAFWRYPEVAAAAWGIVAFGDGFAALAGATEMGPRLAWNSSKSWAGSVAFVLAAAPLTAILICWTAPGKYAMSFLVVAGVLVSMVAAWVESQPLGLDDNLTVPLLSAILLFCVLDSASRWPALFSQASLRRIAIGLLVSLVLGAVAFAGGAVTRSGLVGGSILGALIWAASGWKGFLLMAAFVALGFAGTRVGMREKEERGLAQEDGGRRSLRHAVAKLSVPTAAALFAIATPHSWAFRIAFSGALATATADTVASEIGQVFGHYTVLATSWRPVGRGTEGGISLEGTLAGLAAAILIAVLAAVLGFVSFAEVFPVVLAALAASFAESVMGATLGARGVLDNEAINFLQSLIGALLAVALAVVAFRF